MVSAYSPARLAALAAFATLPLAAQAADIRVMCYQDGIECEVTAAIAKRFPEVARARLVVTGEMANDAMTLKVETSAEPVALASRIGEAIRDITKLRGDVELLPMGSLPNDGKVIEDARSYQ